LPLIFYILLTVENDDLCAFLFLSYEYLYIWIRFLLAQLASLFLPLSSTVSFGVRRVTSNGFLSKSQFVSLPYYVCRYLDVISIFDGFVCNSMNVFILMVLEYFIVGLKLLKHMIDGFDFQNMS